MTKRSWQCVSYETLVQQILPMADGAHTIAEIGERINKPQQTVRNLFHRLLLLGHSPKFRPAPQGRPTDEAIREEVLQWADGTLTAAQISERMGVSQRTVSWHLRNLRALGYSPKVIDVRSIRRYTPDRDLHILQARESGLTLQAIAECFGISRERVRQIIKKGSLPASPSPGKVDG